MAKKLGRFPGPILQLLVASALATMFVLYNHYDFDRNYNYTVLISQTDDISEQQTDAVPQKPLTLPPRWRFPQKCAHVVQDVFHNRSAECPVPVIVPGSPRGGFDLRDASNETHYFHWFRAELPHNDSNGHPYDQMCALDLITHDQALTCLQNRNILFIGDSVMRYQMISLFHFLRYGLWGSGYHVKPPLPQPTSPYTPRYFHEPLGGPFDREKDGFGGWPGYFQNISDVLAPFLIQDTHRDGDGVEQHYYHDSRLGIRLTFSFLFGLMPPREAIGWDGPTFRGDYMFHPPDLLNVTCTLPTPEELHLMTPPGEPIPLVGCSQAYCRPESCGIDKNSPEDPTHWYAYSDRFEGLRNYTLLIKPEVLILNSRIWTFCNDTECIEKTLELGRWLSGNYNLLGKRVDNPREGHIVKRIYWLHHGHFHGTDHEKAWAETLQPNLHAHLKNLTISPWRFYQTDDLMKKLRTTFSAQAKLSDYELLNLYTKDGLHATGWVNALFNQNMLAQLLCATDLQTALG